MDKLIAGTPIVYGGDKVTHVDEALAAAFAPGDKLIIVQSSGDLLHIERVDWDTARMAVEGAAAAFKQMGAVGDDQISLFYETFAARLEDDATFSPIAAANEADVESSKAAGRSTTRLVLSPEMRTEMIDGLRTWAKAPSERGQVVETVSHQGWRVELVRAGLGVVGFVFEGRPNVFADATGVLRSGNTVVFRIGSAALGTARAIVAAGLEPALAEAGLPPGAVSLVDSAARGAGWAMFADDRLALAVARGSGKAVAQLGAVARQSGIPVSLHGTGGAWIVASETADADDFSFAVFHSLDRKVCNTLNTCCIVESRLDLVPVFLDALDRAGRRLGTSAKLHVAKGDESHIPPEWFNPAPIARSEGIVTEPRTEIIDNSLLGEEWEWEGSPEVTLKIVPDVATAVESFNRLSPRFVASLVSSDLSEHERFWDTIDAPFVGNGFTRWVDGQYALDRPELGLSNWQFGRLFGRGGVLSGDSVFSIRTRSIQDDPDIGR
ncbi:MAG: aldehyde dehydrogenase family protein [Acidimicrobiia bacterium]|nr:aldehyde dehydrogenase family protein [Acidimicrobiia bacterium]